MSRFKDGELNGGFEIFYPAYLEGYRNRVLEVYSDENVQGASFTYMDPVLFSVLLRDIDTHLVISRSEKDALFFVDLNEMEVDDYNLLSGTSDKLKRQLIKSITNLDDYLEEVKLNELGRFGSISFKEANRSHLANAAKKWGAEKADSHYNNHQFVEAFEQAVSLSAQLTVVDTDGILERVPNEAFRYEFGEAARAYNAEIYLAAASTGGLALENILRLIIVKEMGIDELPGETYIRTSLNKLNKKEALPGRLHGAVDSLKNIRNSNSHTNEDPVKKTTVDHLFATIEDLSLFLNRNG